MAEPLALGKERAGGCAPAQSHNQIIALDSSFVYQAVTKGQLLSKNSYKAASSNNLRCLITVHSKPHLLSTVHKTCMYSSLIVFQCGPRASRFCIK